MARVVIVGNGKIHPGLCNHIDTADVVIRFNEPSYMPSTAGMKTDILFVVNSGKAIRRWVSSKEYISMPYVAAAREIVLPCSPSIIDRYQPKPNFIWRLKGRRSHWTLEALSVFAQANKLVSILPDSTYDRCCRELQIEVQSRQLFFPSTGFIALQHCLQAYAGRSIELCGFTWQGWERHNWDAEKGWIEAAAKRDQIRLL